MIKKLKYKLIGLFSLIFIILFVGGTGYYFAGKNSEPEYLSKVDKILFDKKNKSPKYIITLPDKMSVNTAAQQDNVETAEAPITPQANDLKSKIARYTAEVMGNIPHISKLNDAEGLSPLPVVEAEEEYEQNINGYILPKIADNGRKPWIEFAQERHPLQPNFYRISILLKGLGVNKIQTEQILTKLPREVSLSFSPYGEDNKRLIGMARNLGHETYADLLLSPKDFLESDNGPLALSITESHEKNIENTYKSIANAMPTGGIVINEGITSSEVELGLKDIMEKVGAMGLLIVDATQGTDVEKIKTQGIARRKADIVITDYTPKALQKAFKEAESIARKQGSVLIVSDVKMSVIKAIDDWAKTFSPQLTYQEMKEQNIETIARPYALVPISAMVVE